MSYKNSLHCTQRYAINFKGFAKSLEAYSAVYEYPAFFSSDKCGISLAGAEKRIKSCHWIFSVLYILTNNDNADIMIKEHTVTVGGQFLLPERGESDHDME
jgi:hypothetical protein